MLYEQGDVSRKFYFIEKGLAQVSIIKSDGTEMLLEFVGKTIGPVFYNEAIEDARATAANRAETIQEELLGLTRGLELRTFVPRT